MEEVTQKIIATPAYGPDDIAINLQMARSGTQKLWCISIKRLLGPCWGSCSPDRSNSGRPPSRTTDRAAAWPGETEKRRPSGVHGCSPSWRSSRLTPLATALRGLRNVNYRPPLPSDSFSGGFRLMSLWIGRLGRRPGAITAYPIVCPSHSCIDKPLIHLSVARAI
jgi:hypothetical protein